MQPQDDLLYNLKAFARELVLRSWDGDDIDGAEIQELAVKFKLIIPTEFDPEKHTDEYGGAEPGDPWYEFADNVKE